MTGHDIYPGLERLPDIDQSLEACSRNCADMRLLLASNRLASMDRSRMRTMLEREQFERDKLMKAKEAKAPLPPCEFRTIDCWNLSYCQNKTDISQSVTPQECRECLDEGAA